ncbi:MAG: diguanylate cyclase [Pirellulaceae bacterium]
MPSSLTPNQTNESSTTGISGHEAAIMTTATNKSNMPFFQCLLDSMNEGVVFIDRNCGIRTWNKGVQALTGLGTAVLGRRLEPSLLQLKDGNRLPIHDNKNPFAAWIEAGTEASDKFFITGRSGRDAQVDLQFFPVLDSENKPMGGVILMRDTSLQVELQKQLNDLYAIATLDPLTQVANRAEFERILDEYIHTHRSVGLSCGIIVCDIDYFKKINDNYGHHVGDQALIAFAALLKQHVRPHDFVARYGGEEFVVLCGHCTEEAAQERAETIRRVLEATAQPMLENRNITASFGVAELADEDDPSSLFVRADQALLRAKETGRNRVIRASTLTPGNKKKKKEERKTIDSVCPNEWRNLKYTPVQVAEFGTSTILQMFIKQVQAAAEDLSATILEVTETSATFQMLGVNHDKPSQKAQMIVDIDVLAPEKSAYLHSFPNNTKLLVRIAITAKKGLFQPRDPAPIAKSLMRDICQQLNFTKENELVVSRLADADKERYG